MKRIIVVALLLSLLLGSAIVLHAARSMGMGMGMGMGMRSGATDYLLMETGDILLLETGEGVLLE